MLQLITHYPVSGRISVAALYTPSLVVLGGGLARDDCSMESAEVGVDPEWRPHAQNARAVLWTPCTLTGNQLFPYSLFRGALRSRSPAAILPQVSDVRLSVTSM